MKKFIIIKVASITKAIYKDEVEALDVSDGYHTMEELYDHRRALTVALFKALNRLPGGYGYRVIKSKKHNDGTMFDGYFIVMAITPSGQISYHYDLKYWDDFKVDSVEAAFPYDDHTSQDVIERLLKL